MTGHKGPGKVFPHESESLVAAVKLTPSDLVSANQSNNLTDRLHTACEALPQPVISAPV